MNIQQTIRKAALIIFSAMIFTACSKEGPQGPAGQQGEQGVAGERGPRGATGAKGEKGDPGTANVFYSDWINPDYDKYSEDVYVWQHTDKRMTKYFLDKGLIMLYYKYANDPADPNNNYLVGPISDLVNYFDEFDAIFLPYANGIDYTIRFRFIVNANDFAMHEHLERHQYYFRYVLIPGGVHIRRSALLPDFDDYHAVCAYYDIPK